MMSRRGYTRYLKGLLAVAVFLWGCSSKSEPEDLQTKQEEPAVAVEVAKVELGTVRSYIRATGTLQACRESRVGPRISGIIKEVRVDEGDNVKGGDVLVVLDTSDLEIARDEAKAALAIAQAQLKKVLKGTREELIEQARARLKEAQALYENAAAELRRVKRLYERGTVPKKHYDQAVAQYKAAQAELKAAKEALRMAQRGATREEVEVARAQVARARVVLQRAEQALRDAVVRAPFGGVVVKRFVNEGEYVSTLGKTPLIWLMDIDPIEVEVQIPETDLEDVAVGDLVDIYPDALHGRGFSGGIYEVLPWVDPKSRKFTIKVRIPNPNMELKAGMFCRVKIHAAERKGVIRVPKVAVLHEAGQTVVFVRKGRRARKRVVTLGAVDDRFAHVISGLKVGEEVVTRGQHYLKEGTKLILGPRG